MFIKKIKSHGSTYYYIVESVRTKNGKVRHKILRYLGTAQNLLSMLEKGE
jgi:hypothetical protein